MSTAPAKTWGDECVEAIARDDFGRLHALLNAPDPVGSTLVCHPGTLMLLHRQLVLRNENLPDDLVRFENAQLIARRLVERERQLSADDLDALCDQPFHMLGQSTIDDLLWEQAWFQRAHGQWMKTERGFAAGLAFLSQARGGVFLRDHMVWMYANGLASESKDRFFRELSQNILTTFGADSKASNFSVCFAYYKTLAEKNLVPRQIWGPWWKHQQDTLPSGSFAEFSLLPNALRWEARQNPDSPPWWLEWDAEVAQRWGRALGSALDDDMRTRELSFVSSAHESALLAILDVSMILNRWKLSQGETQQAFHLGLQRGNANWRDLLVRAGANLLEGNKYQALLSAWNALELDRCSLRVPAKPRQSLRRI